MWNVLLDPLPQEWHGYPIDSDFQTGIQISQCLVDEELSEAERYYTAVGLLFPVPERRPVGKESVEGLKWFLNEYHHDNNTKGKSDVPVMDFDIDQWRIYSAFRKQYQIDLNTACLHWFVFMGLLVNLEECTFTRVMNARQKKITAEMSSREKKALIQAKRVFAIKPQKDEHLTVKEQEAVDAFRELLNKRK